MLAGLQGLCGHCALLLASDREGDGVDVRVGEHVLVLDVGRDPAPVIELRQRPLVQGLEDVPDGDDTVAVQAVHQPEPAQAPVPYPKYAYADLVHVYSSALAARHPKTLA